MAVVFTHETSNGDVLANVIGLETIVVDGVGALRVALADEHVDLPPHDLVVIGPDIDLSLALDLAASERVARPVVGVVLVRRRVDTTVLSQALRAGVREVVPDGNFKMLQEACLRSRSLSHEIAGRTVESEHVAGQVFTVFAAKGGCGKTTIATNMAAALAAGGKRRVCLVDVDLAFGDVGVSLRLQPTHTIADALGFNGMLDEGLVRNLLTPHSTGLDVVLAPLHPGDAETISGELVGDLLRVLRRMFDIVVVDTPPAFYDHVLVALDQSDYFLLLTTPDVPALKNLKLTMETLDQLGYARDRSRVIVNRADSRVGLTPDDVRATLNAEIAAQVPSSRDVPATTNRGVPIVHDDPRHPVSREVSRLASVLIGAPATATRSRHAGRDRGALKLLRRRTVPA